MTKSKFDVTDRIIPKQDIPIQPPVPIAICTPMYNSMPFINRYISALTKLDYPDEMISLYFTVQGDDDTLNYMRNTIIPWMKKNRKYKRIKLDKVKQVKGGKLPHVRNVTHCRNLMIKWSNPDPILFIDHDNFPPPETVHRLRQTAMYGADIVGGVYVFFQSKREDDEGMLGFTTFFIHDGTYYYLTLDRSGVKGLLDAKIIGSVLRCEAVSMGATYIKRHVFNKQKFYVPYGTTMTDDTAFCLKAVEQGIKIVSDYGLFVPHWGFNVHFHGVRKGKMLVTVDFEHEMALRRLDMKNTGIYPN